VRQEYNSNIFFDSSNDEDDFITRVKPGLELVNRTERLDLRLAGFVTPYLYWSNDNLNSVDQDYSGRVDYRLTPLLSLGANAAVRVDHQPDRDIYTTGLAYSDNRRLQQNYGGNVGYMFTEKTGGSVTYGYTREDWRNSSNNSDLEDYDSHAVTVGLSHDVGSAKGVTVGLLNAGWAHYNYQTSDTDYYFSTVGVKHRLTEIFNISGDVGVRYTDSTFDVESLVIVPPGVLATVTDQQSDSNWGGIGHLSVEYVGERTRASLGASQDVTAASGGQGVVQRTGLTFNGGHLLTEKLRLGFFTGVFRNKSDENEFSGEKTEEYSYSVSPNLRWEFYRDVTLEAGYSFTYLDNQADNESALRHLGYIQLAYGLPLFE
jgi:outer membrane protein assembly factor BamA